MEKYPPPRLILGLFGALAFGFSAISQSVLHSTHDWPNYQNNNAGTNDRALDCKVPGDGRTYIVGTSFVADTDPNPPTPAIPPHFSNSGISGPPGFHLVTGHRQVAYLQVKNADGSIVHQAYFHGWTDQQQQGGFSTVGRAISVFPGATAPETRIAICGETYDHTLPSAVTSANPHSDINTGFSPCSGFIAVYDGSAALLWSYQFYGSDISATTMVTDLSIRVEGGIDLITYCGNSTNGAFSGSVASTMDPLRAFAPPPAISGCVDVPAAGNTHVAPNNIASTTQWDGFVGRLSMPHAGPFALTATTRVFHSIVGGDFQDSLFGLAEIDANQFIVVGSTRNLPSLFGTPYVIPLWRPIPFNSALPICFGTNPSFDCFGTVFWFDATPTRSGGALVLSDSTLIGSANAATVARDVVASAGRAWIVGSTNDPNFTSLDPNPIDGSLTGTYDGYVVVAKNGSPTFDQATYLGDKDLSACTGITQWNEHPDHASVLSWNEHQGQSDFVVHSLFLDAYSQSAITLRLIRELTHGGSLDERPAYTQTLTRAGVISSDVGALEGGGIAMDHRGRVTIVGSTSSTNYPFDPNNPLERGTQPGHVAGSPDTDSVMAVIDMLPPGVCRTDGSGACNPIWTLSPAHDGGTTPPCAISPFGALIGTAPELQRMLIDFEGVAQAGAFAHILLDRPAAGSILQGSIMQIAFASPNPVVITGIEQWMNHSSGVSQLYFTNYTSLRVPLTQLPPGSNQFGIQFVCLLANSVCSNQAFQLGASPGLMFGY
ncbi:MAG: hypothetical protein KA020_04775 [Planctomycetes bacterium]|nr:hypothetical protein [Planctomycetota bacterium]